MTEESSILIGVEPTRHCNLRCVHCLRADTKTHEEIPFVLLERLLEQASAYGRPHIALTGGEATLHSRFLDILGAIQERNFTCHFVTNGSTFAELVGDLERYRPALCAISFSLDGATRKVHDSIRGRGSFDQVTLAIALAVYRGHPVTVQMVINRLNRGELGAVQELATDLGVERLFFGHAWPTPSLYRRDIQLTPTQWHEVEAEVADLAHRDGMVTPFFSTGYYDASKVAPCTTLQHRALNIDYRGRLTFCCNLSGVGDGDAVRSDVIADLNTESLADAHAKLIGRIGLVVTERLAEIGHPRDAAPSSRGFPCLSCHKRFSLVDWLSEYPDDPWVADDPDFAGASEGANGGVVVLRRRAGVGSGR